MRMKLTKVRGIGPRAAAALYAHEIESVETLAETDVATIAGIRGFGPASAQRILAAACEAIGGQASDSRQQSAAPKGGDEGKKRWGKRKGGKDKKKTEKAKAKKKAKRKGKKNKKSKKNKKK